jgi:hypothetical protein
LTPGVETGCGWVSVPNNVIGHPLWTRHHVEMPDCLVRPERGKSEKKSLLVLQPGRQVTGEIQKACILTPPFPRLPFFFCWSRRKEARGFIFGFPFPALTLDGSAHWHTVSHIVPPLIFQPLTKQRRPFRKSPPLSLAIRPRPRCRRRRSPREPLVSQTQTRH